ncbi:MAG TPA: hypothetical protein VKW78_20020 [Terriglobales bacterium]|nr:hypothetical protein [Terriglobales bacterium]
MASAQSRVSTDHDEIRKWAEDRGAEPACVRGTGEEGDIGMLRLEFPGAPGARDQSLQPISWDDWFQKFDERGLALLFQEETARGQQSNFNKIIARGTAEAREEGDIKASRRSVRGHRGGARSARARSSEARSHGKGKGSRSTSARKASGSRTASRKSASRSSSRKTASGRRSASGRSASKRASAGTRSTGSRSRRTSSRGQSSSRQSTGKKAARSTRSTSATSERASSRSRRTSSARGRQNGRAA